MLWEVQPAWPGTDQFVQDRYKDSPVKQITEEQFLEVLATRKVAYYGDWKSPAGPARLFYIAVKDHELAVGITTNLDVPKFYQLLPSNPRQQVGRVKLRR